MRFRTIEQLERREMLAGELLATVLPPNDTSFIRQYEGAAVATSQQYHVTGKPYASASTGLVEVYSAFDHSHVATIENPQPTSSHQFGSSVAVDGNTVVVGAPYNSASGSYSGSVYVYDISSGEAVLSKTLTAPAADSQDRFGISVAIDENQIVVGAPYGGANNQGIVHVYDATSGSSSPTLSILGQTVQSRTFGWDVDIDGDTVIASAPFHRSAAGVRGHAYVYDIAGQSATLSATIGNPSTSNGNGYWYGYFGTSIDVSDGRAVIGAYGERVNGVSFSGLAYVYDIAGGGASLIASLSAPTLTDGQFGYSTDIDGDTIVVGEWRNGDAGANAGAAHVFEITGGSVALRHTLTSPSADPTRDYAGRAVAVSGDRVVFGAYNDDTNGQAAGHARVYDVAGGTATLVGSLNTPGAEANERFGSVLATTENRLIVASPYEDSAEADAGSVYIYDTTTGTPQHIASIQHPAPDRYDQFGNSVAIDGDILAIGVPNDDLLTGQTDVGTVQVFDLSGVTPSLLASIDSPTPNPYERFGFSLAVDGQQIAVGTPRDNGSQGTVSLYDVSSGSAVLLETIASPTPTNGDHFGHAIAFQGDRLAIGQLGSQRAVRLYDLSSGTAQLDATLTSPTATAADSFGEVIAIDGNNLLLSAADDDTSGANSGVVHFYDLTSGSPVLQSTLSDPDPEVNARFGRSITIDGDNLAIGSRRTDGVGRVDSFSLATGTPVLQETYNNPQPDQYNEQFGNTLEFNGNQLFVGSASDDTQNVNQGAVYVYGPPPIAPIAVADFASTDENAATDIYVLANDTDEDSLPSQLTLTSIDSFQVNGLAQPVLPVGTLSIANNQIAFVPGFAFDPLKAGESAVITIDYTVTDETGRSDSSTLELTVTGTNDPLAAQFELPAGPFVEGTPIPVVASSADVDGTSTTYSYTVTKDGAAFDSDSGVDLTSFTFTPDDQGTYVVALTASDPAGDSDTISQTISVINADPTSVLSLITDDPQIGGPVYLLGSGTDPAGVTDTLTFDYSVTKNGAPYGSASGQGLTTFQFTPDGFAVYSVQLTVTDEDGGVGIDTLNLPLIVTAGDLLATVLPNEATHQGQQDGYSVATNEHLHVLGSPFAYQSSFTSSGIVKVFDTATGNLLATIENPTPGTDDRFGESVAVSGTRVAVGAYQDDAGAAKSGVVHVFDFASGVAHQVATINNPTPAAEDHFGFSVAFDGDTLVVGARNDDTSPGNEADSLNAGSVYVFDLSQNIVTHRATIHNPDPQSNDSFGESVAIDSNDDTSVVVVGAIRDQVDSSLFAGSAYVFDIVGNSALLRASISNPTPAFGDQFGNAVAIEGDTVVVAAYRESTLASTTGAAYVYDISNGAALTATLDNPSPAAGDFFGKSLSISGDQLVVGAYRGDIGGTDHGNVYVYDLASGSNAPQMTISSPVAQSFSNFGWAASVHDSTVLVGTYRDNTLAASAGAGHVFDVSSGAAVLATTLNATGRPQSGGTGFSRSVGLDGDLMVVGEPFADSGAGQVSVYDFSTGEAILLAKIANPSPNASDQFGTAVAIDGDSIAVGAPFDDTSSTNGGSVYLFDVSTGTPSLQHTINGNNAGYLGSSLALDDQKLFVGAPNDSTLATFAGRGFLYDVSGPTANLLSTLENPTPDNSDRFGTSAAMDNGKLIIGVPFDDLTGTNAGTAYFYDVTGSSASLRATRTGVAGAAFGTSVAIDNNRAAIGAYRESNGTLMAGRVHSYDVSSLTNPVLETILENPTPVTNDQFGYRVAVSGDAVIVSDPGDDLIHKDSGSVYVFDLDSGTAELENTLVNPNPGQQDYFGDALAASGGRVAVGAYNNDTYNRDMGAVYLFGNHGLSPIANADAFSIDEDTPGLFDVLSNDTDPDSAPSSFQLLRLDSIQVSGPISVSSLPPNVLSIAGDQLYFAPNGLFDALQPSQSATITANYTMADGFGQESASTFTLTITGVEDPLTARIESLSLPHFPGVPVNVVASAEDPDSPAPLNYAYTILKDGATFDSQSGVDLTSINFTPDADAQYEISLAVNGVTTTKTIDVASNLSAVDDEITTNEDSSVTFDVLAANINAADIGPVAIDATLTAAAFGTGPTRGVLTDNGNGSFTYDPQNAFESLPVGSNDLASFRYSIEDTAGNTDVAAVTITISGVNDPPQISDTVHAVDYQSLSSPLDLIIDDPDSDFDIATLTYTLTQPTEGNVTLLGNGMFQFDPGTDFGDLTQGDHRQVTFQISATDTHGGTGSTATITLDVYRPTFQSLDLITSVQDAFPSATAMGNSSSGSQSVSDDGRYVVFASTAPNLVPNDFNDDFDIFRYDRVLDVVELVSVDSDGTGSGNRASVSPMISGDGTTVAFLSKATNLISGVNTGSENSVFVRTLGATPGTTWANEPIGGGTPDSHSSLHGISDDGGTVVFTSLASNLVPGDTNGERDVFARVLSDSTLQLVSVNASGTGPGNNASSEAVISGNGLTVAFGSEATDLVGTTDTNNRSDIFTRSLSLQTTTLVSINSSSTAAGGGADPSNGSFEPAISDDGTVVAFSSFANDLVSTPANVFYRHIYVRVAGTGTFLASTNAASTNSGNFSSFDPQVNSDGSTVFFLSQATDISPLDTNFNADVYAWDVTTQATELISVNDAGTIASNGYVDEFSISNDGSVVAFVTNSTNLTPNSATNLPSEDVFIRSRPDSTTRLVSLDLTGVGTRTDSRFASISGDGSTVSFSGTADNIVADDRNLRQDVFASGLLSGDVPELLSKTHITLPSSTSATFQNGAAVASDDGRYVAFESDSPFLVPGDDNNGTDIFRLDRLTGVIELVSVNQFSTGTGNSLSTNPSISADGSKVAYQSLASDLVDRDGSHGTFQIETKSDVFVRDFSGVPTTTLISSNAAGTFTANNHSTKAKISADGSTVAFESTASDLTGLNITGTNVYARKTDGSATVLVSSATTNGFTASGRDPVISGDGSVVAFVSTSDNLVAADNNFQQDVFAHNLSSNFTTLVSVNESGHDSANSTSEAPVISRDGSTVGFQSSATNLVSGDSNGQRDVFVRRLSEPNVVLISENATASGSGNLASSGLRLSSDGSMAAFNSVASDLVSDDNNTASDVFLRDIAQGTTTLISANHSQTDSADAASTGALISADGNTIAFQSDATNLIVGDDNGAADAFLYSVETNTTRIASASDDGLGNNDSTLLSLSGDGSVALISSEASNLEPNDFNESEDTFVYQQRELILKRIVGDNLNQLTIRLDAGNVVIVDDLTEQIIRSESLRSVDSISIFGVVGEDDRVTVDFTPSPDFLILPGGLLFDGGDADADEIVVRGNPGETTAAYRTSVDDATVTELLVHQDNRTSVVSFRSAEEITFIDIDDIQYEPTLNVGDSLLSFESSELVVLPPQTVLAGGEIQSASSLSLDVSDMLSGNGTITTPNDAAQAVVLNGTVDGDSLSDPISLAGYIKGTGTLNNVAITGTHAPGASPSAISVGNIRYESGGVLSIEIDGPTAGSQYDTIDASGTVELGGSLALSSSNGYIPTAGTQYAIITTTSGVTGMFDGLGEGGLLSLGGVAMQITYFGGAAGNDVVLSRVPAAPVAVNDTAMTNENQPLTIDVLDNDTDADSPATALTLTAISGVAVTGLSTGPSAPPSVVTIVDNKIQFAPGFVFDELALNDVATVLVNYTVSDDTGLQSTGTLTISVNGLEESALNIVVDSTADAGPGSLRDAIAAANSQTGESIISFVFAQLGPQVIELQSPLPAITSSVTIDATTLPEFAFEPIVAINGAGAGVGADGLRLRSSAATVRGLAIYGFDGDGIEIFGGGNHTVSQNFLGLDLNGSAAPNFIGIKIASSAGNVVDNNTISGNGRAGVSIVSVLTEGNTLINNRIGTDATGSFAIPNATDGITLRGGHNQIGGIGQGNIISGNTRWGVFTIDVGRGENVIQGNAIGVNIDGDSLPNVIGVYAKSEGNVIGGANAGEGNVISGNHAFGIAINTTNAHSNVIQGNQVGTNALGTDDVGNGLIGVRLIGAVGNTIGGTGPGEGNVISGNDSTGVLLALNARDNVIAGNRIGTTADGLLPLGNSLDGVRLAQGSSDNVVTQNQISGNGLRGVVINQATSARNDITFNTIGTTPDGLSSLHNGFGGAVRVLTPQTLIEGNTIAGPDVGVIAFRDAVDLVIKDNTIGLPAGPDLPTAILLSTGASNAEVTGNAIQNVQKGIAVAGVTTGVRIQGNSIENASAVGIDLGNNGTTANDSADTDTGANNLQNSPVLIAAVLSGNDLTLTYSVDSIAQASTYGLTIEFFLSDGSGSGKRSIGTNIYTEAERLTSKTITLTVTGVNVSDQLVATATDLLGNTSEFSAELTIAP